MKNNQLLKDSSHDKTRLVTFLGITILFVLLVSACQSSTPVVTAELSVMTEEPGLPTEQQAGPTDEPLSQDIITPSVTVEDQAIQNGTVTIKSIVSDGAGWLVVHAQADGKPGAVLGYSLVNDGENGNVVVEIDEAGATETLYAMLHSDAGEIGVFEFPEGPDGPVTVDGSVITPPFRIAAHAAVPGDELLNLGSSEELGSFLTDARGMTLYLFTVDGPGKSNCYEQCAVNWPPFLLDEGQQLTAGEGITGDLGSTSRDDGGEQVTYNGFPIYYWLNDEEPGDTTGHGVGSVWAVVSPGVMGYQIDPDQSNVSYEVGETFLNQDNRFNAAVGVTRQVEGKVILDMANPLSAWVAPITVDISQFVSDSERRDNALRSDFLESSRYPLATFDPTSIEGLPETYRAGEEITFQISGDLTVRDVTNPATFEATVSFENGVLSGNAIAVILMSDYGVGPISIFGILETEDEVQISFDFIALEQTSPTIGLQDTNSNSNDNSDDSNSYDNGD